VATASTKSSCLPISLFFQFYLIYIDFKHCHHYRGNPLSLRKHRIAFLGDSQTANYHERKEKKNISRCRQKDDKKEYI
jgi:hypothetical protein